MSEKFRGILYGMDGKSFPLEGDADEFAHSHEHEVAYDFPEMEAFFLPLLKKRTFAMALSQMVERYGKEATDAWLEQRTP